jgi:hypothetical protein
MGTCIPGNTPPSTLTRENQLAFTANTLLNTSLMKGILSVCALSLFTGLLPSSCTTTSGYQEVSYGGSLYYYHHGHYYRRHWYGYRPCPNPPDIPDRPPHPEHPIAKPERSTTLPTNSKNHTQPTPRPTTPTYRPTYRPAPHSRPRASGRMR